jgi:hypothetical protein
MLAEGSDGQNVARLEAVSDGARGRFLVSAPACIAARMSLRIDAG